MCLKLDACKCKHLKSIGHDTCTSPSLSLFFLWKHNFKTVETLKTENEEFKKKYEEATSKVLQLEEDIMTVTQKAIAKETELDRYTSKIMLYFLLRLEQS